MKKNITSFLAMVLMLILVTGCSSNDNEVEDTTPVVENNESDDNQTEDVEEIEDVEEDDVEETEDVEEATDEEDTDEIGDATSLMIEESDYISKVKLITKGKSDTEIKVLENIKDVISASDLPDLDLKENRAYLVFLKDDGDDVVLVDGENSVILLEGDNHELFEKINKSVHR